MQPLACQLAVLKICPITNVFIEGHFTPSKKRTRFFRTKGFLRIFDGFFLQTKGFLPQAYEIFWSEMPLGVYNSHKKLTRSFDRTRGLCDPGLTTPDHTTILPQAQAKVLCIWLTRLCYDVLILPLFSMSTEVLLSDRGSG